MFRRPLGDALTNMFQVVVGPAAVRPEGLDGLCRSLPAELFIMLVLCSLFRGLVEQHLSQHSSDEALQGSDKLFGVRATGRLCWS